MSTLKRVSQYSLIAVAALMLAACGMQKEPAQKAIADIEAAVTTAGADAERFIPDHVATVKAKVAEFKTAFEQGDYKSIITNAPALLTEAQGLAGMAAAKKEEFLGALQGEWVSLAADLPNAVASIQGRVDSLSKMRRLPNGIEKAAVESAGAGLTEAKSMWDEATAAFGTGSIEDAVAKAKSVKAKLGEIQAAIGTG